MKTTLAIAALGIGFAFVLFRRTKADDQDNKYMPIQSDSELAAGHPLVGAS